MTNEDNQQKATDAHLITTLDTVEDVVSSMTEEEREAIRQRMAENETVLSRLYSMYLAEREGIRKNVTGETIFDQLNALTEEERDELLKDIADRRARLEECAALYNEKKQLLDNNYESLLSTGYPESDLVNLPLAPLLNTEWVAQQLQKEPGNGPVGAELVAQLRDGAPKGHSVRGQSVRVTAILSGLSNQKVSDRLTGEQPITVNEAAQLAVAYGITTGELLGILDADEVRLLALYRSGTEEQRKALLSVIEPWDK